MANSPDLFTDPLVGVVPDRSAGRSGAEVAGEAAAPPAAAPAAHPATAPAAAFCALPDPERLHPALWRAHQLGGGRGHALASGFAALDAELPDHGWPSRALTELLLPHPGIGELRLLAPALVALQRDGRHVMLLDPPAQPCGWTLAALGLDLRRLVLVHGRGGGEAAPRARPDRPRAAADLLWAFEQALGSGHLGAVLAWLPPRVRPESLRRLQLAAQAHDGPVFVLRDAAEQVRPSAAPLRLRLAPGGPDELLLGIVKRRGPPLAQPLRLALAPVLPAAARARALRQPAGRPATEPAPSAQIA